MSIFNGLNIFKRKKPTGRNVAEEVGELCEKMSFTTLEQYKMLRTKIDLVLPDELSTDETNSSGASHHRCRIIGVTSALRGEGKSTTSINIAYSFAEAGYKVCLLDADMRLPSIAKRLEIDRTPGLSNILTGKVAVKDAVQEYTTKNGTILQIISAGDIPPLPSELLESKNMRVLLDSLSNIFDCIFIDLPPVNLVTDALAVTKTRKLDGMLYVVRREIGDKRSMRHALEQLQLAETRLLGIVFNAANETGTPSNYYRGKGRYKYYNKYYANKYYTSKKS